MFRALYHQSHSPNSWCCYPCIRSLVGGADGFLVLEVCEFCEGQYNGLNTRFSLPMNYKYVPCPLEFFLAALCFAMVSHIFLATPLPAVKHVQPPLRPRNKITLDAEDLATRRADWRAKSALFKEDLNVAWHQFSDKTKDIAAKHSKSVRRVEDDLHLSISRLAQKKTKTNAWNAFCWLKRADEKASEDAVNGNQLFHLMYSTLTRYA